VGAWHGEIWNRRKNGEVFPAMLSITSLRNAEGDISHYIGTMDDISLSKRNEEKIRYLAFHDALTGLSNRVLFADRTLTGIQRAKRENRQLAMIVLDLDGFKQVNDTYGHAVGDLLLIEVGRRLQGVLRAEDTLARFGGDEFTALLPMIDEPLDALTVAQKILAAIETPVVLATHQVQVSASIGISIYPAHGEDYQALFAAADSAMYQVKVTGKAGFRIAAAMATPSMRLSNPTTDGPE
jgi:diguanylate cyclase (GGDEF)-like protein